MRTLGIVTTPPGHRADVLLESALGRPLLGYAAQAALASYRLSRVVLCTSSPRLAEAGEELGFELFPAPAEADPIGVLQTVVREVETEEQRPCDAVMVLPAIHPLRNRDDIDGSIQLLERTGADTVATFTRRRAGPARFARIDAEGRVSDGAEAHQAFQRVDSITCCRRHLLMERATLDGTDCRAWLLPPERCCAVEDDFDQFLLEQLLRYPGRTESTLLWGSR
jgi:CMP-N-acetylneuraminic acid synthetase